MKSSFNLIYKPITVSTNDDAKEMALQGVQTNVVIWAGQQTKGRGRRSRDWYSPEGNLYLSVLIPHIDDFKKAPDISFVACNALVDCLRNLLPKECHDDVKVKWPNDILFKEKKIAGILLESADGPSGKSAYLIVGVGINLKFFPKDCPYKATSLLEEGYGFLEPKEILDDFCFCFFQALSIWYQKGFQPIRERWLENVKGLDQLLEVRLENINLTGYFRGLSEKGALLLDQQNGTLKEIYSGDVFPL